MRRTYQGIVGETSVLHDIPAGEIRISTDQGRALRPLYIVEGGQLKIRRQQVLAVGEQQVDRLSFVFLVLFSLFLLF